MPDIFSKEKRSMVMGRIRGRGTKNEQAFEAEHPEVVPHPDWLPHSPDFLLDGTAVYVDSAFWHGLVPRKTYDGMTPFWKEKLFRNILRDCVADSFWSQTGRPALRLMDGDKA